MDVDSNSAFEDLYISIVVLSSVSVSPCRISDAPSHQDGLETRRWLIPAFMGPPCPWPVPNGEEPIANAPGTVSKSRT